MGIKIAYTEATYEVVDAGVYTAKLAKIEEGTGDYGDYLRFVWTLLDEDGEETDTEISGICNAVLNPRSKLNGWVRAHLGRDIQDGEEIDLDECKGKRVMLTLTVEQRKDGQGDRNKVVAISPAARRRAPAAASRSAGRAPATAAAAADEDGTPF